MKTRLSVCVWLMFVVMSTVSCQSGCSPTWPDGPPKRVWPQADGGALLVWLPSQHQGKVGRVDRQRRLLWVSESPGRYWSAPPVVFSKTVVLGYGTTLEARALDSGRVLWRQEAPVPYGIQETPAGLLLTAENTLVLYEPSTGKRLQSWPTQGVARAVSAPHLLYELNNTLYQVVPGKSTLKLISHERSCLLQEHLIRVHRPAQGPPQLQVSAFRPSSEQTWSVVPVEGVSSTPRQIHTCHVHEGQWIVLLAASANTMLLVKIDPEQRKVLHSQNFPHRTLIAETRDWPRSLPKTMPLLAYAPSTPNRIDLIVVGLDDLKIIAEYKDVVGKRSLGDALRFRLWTHPQAHMLLGHDRARFFGIQKGELLFEKSLPNVLRSGLAPGSDVLWLVSEEGLMNVDLTSDLSRFRAGDTNAPKPTSPRLAPPDPKVGKER